MKKVLFGAFAAAFLLASSPASAGLFSSGPFWANTFPFNTTTAQDKAYDKFNPSPNKGVNSIRPPGTENLTKTANKVIYSLFGISKFTYFFGLR